MYYLQKVKKILTDFLATCGKDDPSDKICKYLGLPCIFDWNQNLVQIKVLIINWSTIICKCLEGVLMLNWNSSALTLECFHQEYADTQLSRSMWIGPQQFCFLKLWILLVWKKIYWKGTTSATSELWSIQRTMTHASPLSFSWIFFVRTIPTNAMFERHFITRSSGQLQIQKHDIAPLSVCTNVHKSGVMAAFCVNKFQPMTAA